EEHASYCTSPAETTNKKQPYNIMRTLPSIIKQDACQQHTQIFGNFHFRKKKYIIQRFWNHPKHTRCCCKQHAGNPFHIPATPLVTGSLPWFFGGIYWLN